MALLFAPIHHVWIFTQPNTKNENTNQKISHILHYINLISIFMRRANLRAIVCGFLSRSPFPLAINILSVRYVAFVLNVFLM
tara:strand:- start:6529 stop:6774 length:246 start_codon:yes stop_codon:yes gene_type:complete